MIASLLAAAVLHGPMVYSGPKIAVTMENGKSFVIQTDAKNSPKTVAHIVALANRKFYDGQCVHRVESWVTQWGAPASRTKDLKSEEVTGGGSGKDIPFEMHPDDFLRGTVGIASTGLQVGGDSQIFVLKRDTLRLYHSYAILGRVAKGMETVDAIKKGDRIKSIRVISK